MLLLPRQLQHLVVRPGAVGEHQQGKVALEHVELRPRPVADDDDVRLVDSRLGLD